MRTSTIEARRAVAADQAIRGKVSTLALIVFCAIAYGEPQPDGSIRLSLSDQEWTAATTKAGQPMNLNHLRGVIRRGIEEKVLAEWSRLNRLTVVAPGSPL